MKQKTLLFSWLLAMLFSIVGASPAWGDEYVLVTDASQLSVGDVILITNSKSNGSISALGPQTGNNCPAKSISVSSNSISSKGDAQEITLESKNASGYFTFQVGTTSFLYAASSSKNYLKAKTDKSYWQITINTTSSVAAITDKTTTSSRNKMKFNENNGSPIFSCYSSADNNLFVFKKQTAPTYALTITEPTGGTITVLDDEANEVSSGDKFEEGTELTIGAEASPGYSFTTWTKSAGTFGSAATTADNTFTMPASAVTIGATFTKNSYDLTLTNTNGTLAVSIDGEDWDGSSKIPYNAEVKITATPNDGYLFGEWTSTDIGDFDEMKNPLTFNMPVGNVEIKASFVDASSYYSITVDDDVTGGTISADMASAAEDATITLTAIPSTGYTFTSWIVKDAGDNTITVTDNKFTMPASNVTVTATFTAIAVTGVTLNKSTVSIGVGDTETLTATVAPSNALDKTVTWTSDNTSVATVNAATGVVTGVAVGSATITATTADGSFTATCDVTVENVVTFDATKDKKTSLTKSGVHFDCTNGVMDNGSEYRLYKNSKTIISVESGKIMKIEFFGVSGNPASGFADQSGWTTDGNDGTWTGSATSVSFTASGAQVRATIVKVTVATTATPTFSVAAGEYAEAKSLEISCATDGASIYYTTNGDTPTSSSTAYSSAIDITTTTTLKAIAIKDGVDSDVASATYTMNRPAAPTFDVAAGVFDAAFGLHLSTETDGATIYYTTDGTDPTSSSTAYSDGVSIPAEDTTVKAIAVKNGLTSDVATAVYTYDTRIAPTFTLSATELNLKVNETSSEVTLTTNNDNDGTVDFNCADPHVTLTGTGNSRTISANAAGVYTVNVTTAATAKYLAGAGTITVTVTKKGTTMVLTPSFTSKDLYVTTSGSLTGVPQYNSSNIAGAEVTYSSSDETVATIAADGAVTFNKAGSTTLTASYAGNDEYEACQETYVLDLTDSTPQEPVVEITPNYTFFGKDSQFSGNTNDELTGEQNNVSVTYTRNSGSTYANTTAMRFYKSNELTITAPTNYRIVGITLTLGDTSSDITADKDTYTASTGVWSGDATSVTFTRPSNASSYATISKITVTLGSVVTLSSACFGGTNYYGTYSNGNAFVVPEGLRVSAITYNTTTKKIELDNYSTGDIVAAGEGVLVSSKTYGDYTVELTNVTETSKSGNLLVGTGDSGATASDMSDTNYYYYRLTMKDDKPGFWWKTAEGAGFALAANRAYLKVSKETAASARGFNLFNDEDETTGIHSIENGKLTMENGAWYTLGGQKMNGKPATKGIYIIKGKKVVVK